MKRASIIDAQESNLIRSPGNLDKRSSFHTTVRPKNEQDIRLFSSYIRLFVLNN